MKTSFRVILVTIQSLLTSSAGAATLYVDLNNPNPATPYTSWSTAATNIQNAIDAATDGDLVLVTNGVYVAGGKVMFGDLTNRVALDKAITVQSMNGPWVTTIRGAGATNGPAAVRCAWLTNGAILHGFTLTAGATRTSGDQTNLLDGGGALCWSTNALLRNCLIISNVAQTYGGGVYQGVVANSAILGNRATTSGSGAAYATLLNCTVVSNWQSTATHQSRHTNTIIYYNNAGNYTGVTLANSCSPSVPGGGGNITSAPQLYPDGIHLQSTSPCRGAGANLTTGNDIDGRAWEAPPSIGCDEWGGKPVFITQPRLQLTNSPISFKVMVEATGQEPLDYYWFQNGVLATNDGHFSSAQSSNLVALGVSQADAGSYQVVVSNSLGAVTSAVAQLVFRYVNASNSAPLPPFTTWAGAATNIQDAIDTAAVGEVILVTNGVYCFGGRVMESDLTNRVALNKAIILQSVNGPEATIIEGRWNPTVTNGMAAIRGVWMTNGAVVNGFTIRGGATRVPAGSGNNQMFGGGVWASSTNAIIYNSLIVSNTAGYQGGGAYQVSLVNCTLAGNRAVGSGIPGSGFAGAGEAGGAASSHLRNCIIRGNTAEQGRAGGVGNSKLFNCALVENSCQMDGAAAYGGTLVNCTVMANTASGYSSGYGAAVHSANLTNCIVWGNFSRTTYPNTNYANSTLSYCVSHPLAAGVGNLSIDPQLLGDGAHVTETSPARAAGINLASGADIDGEVWSNPPSIGCDEWSAAPRIVVSPTNTFTYVSRRMTWRLPIAGQPPFGIQWFKDGQLLSDDDHYAQTATVGMAINKFGPEHGGQYFVVASNSFGMATSKVVSVVIHCVAAAAANPIPPYSSWATAANTIQAAVDVAQSGDIVLVTNGIYNTGGKVMSGSLSNRVVIDRSITVLSVNGYRNTIIEGAWDPISTNGPAAVRGVWMTNGATLVGLTIRNGATLAASSTAPDSAGGGLYAPSAGATVINCLLTNNAAHAYGGGAYLVKLNNSLILGNYAGSGGGGAACGELANCTVGFNSVGLFGTGGGVAGNVGFNPTVIKLRNSIVGSNYRSGFMTDNYTSSGTDFAYCASVSGSGAVPSGAGNIMGNMSFVDSDYHISTVSSYRGMGSSLYAFGEDLDGEPWANPPSMGVDEVIEANLTGPISLVVHAQVTNTVASPSPWHSVGFWDSITGRVSRIDWDFGDGSGATNLGYTVSHIWTNPGTYTVTSTAYNADNANGVSASVIIQADPLIPPLLQSGYLDVGGFNFSFQAQTNTIYTIQYTTNLAAPITWYTLKGFIYSPGGPTLITDPAWTNAARFYRVMAW